MIYIYHKKYKYALTLLLIPRDHILAYKSPSSTSASTAVIKLHAERVTPMPWIITKSLYSKVPVYAITHVKAPIITA